MYFAIEPLKDRFCLSEAASADLERCWQTAKNIGRQCMYGTRFLAVIGVLN